MSHIEHWIEERRKSKLEKSLLPLSYLLFSKYLSFKLSEILIRKIQKLTKFLHICKIVLKEINKRVLI